MRLAFRRVALRVSPCRTLCDWRPTRGAEGGLRTFACAGCGSQWRRTEGWTPRQADGTVSSAVRDELAVRDEPAARDEAHDQRAAAATSAPHAAGAGSAGS